MLRLSEQWNLLDAKRRGAVLTVARALEEAGHRAWLVGGAVRDLLLGQEVGDLDMVSKALPDEVVELFPHSREVGRSFGIVQVEAAGRWIELATFRLERGYSDGRRPDEVQYTESLEKDAGRRDFTCNALYLDPLTMEVRDPKAGVADLEKGQLACVGDAKGRFEEDGLRLLRMARFLARLGLKPAAGLFEAAASSRDSLRGVSGERVLEELKRMAEGPASQVAMGALASSKLLGLAITVGKQEVLSDEPLRLAAWERISVANAAPSGLELALLLSIFLDPAPGQILRESEIRSTAQSAFRLLRASSCLGQQVTDLWHLRSYFANNPKQDSVSIRAFRGPQGPLALELARTWKELQGEQQARVETLLAWFEELPKSRVWPDFLPSGQQLLERGIPAGPRMGELMRAVEDAALMGVVKDQASAVDWVLAQGPLS
ncbi:MAG: CCA tRNA nucleotidyltransferase [bacterium]|nr:CCA tRNA nucleotidyltransferase [bacterium]